LRVVCLAIIAVYDQWQRLTTVLREQWDVQMSSLLPPFPHVQIHSLKTFLTGGKGGNGEET
jgi:hypothetical protein